MNCFSHLCYFPNTNRILKWQMGIFWVDYTHFPFFFFPVEIIRFFWRPTKWCKGGKKENFWFFNQDINFHFVLTRRQLGKIRITFTHAGNSEFLYSSGYPAGCILWAPGEPYRTRFSGLHSWPPAFQPRICTWKLVPMIHYHQPSPGLLNLALERAQMVALPLGCDPRGLQPHVPGVGHLTLSGMLSQVPSKATELESTF